MSDAQEAALAAPSEEPETVWIDGNITLRRQRDGSYEGVVTLGGRTTGIRAWRNKNPANGEFSLIQFQAVRQPSEASW